MDEFNQIIKLTHDGDLHAGLWLKIKEVLSSKEGVDVRLKEQSELQISFPTYL